MIPQDIEKELIGSNKKFPLHAVNSQCDLLFQTVTLVSIVLSFENSAISPSQRAL
jgi:hypothetical protein